MVARISDEPPTVGLSGTGARVMAALRAVGGLAGVDDIAAQLGLHRNTVRFQLEKLVTKGLVQEGRQANGRQGRPRAVFRPTSYGARSGQRNYQLMASVLIDRLAKAATDPKREAQEAGRSWGRQLAATAKVRSRHCEGTRATMEMLAELIVEMFAEMGFEPHLNQQQPTHIQLRNCPFREAVDEHQELVCALHAGLLEGMLVRADQGGPDAAVAVRLEPFAKPGVCTIHL